MKNYETLLEQEGALVVCDSFTFIAIVFQCTMLSFTKRWSVFAGKVWMHL